MAVKQTISWRNDLHCRTGKKMAQAGHAALSNLSNTIRGNSDAEGNVFSNSLQINWHGMSEIFARSFYR